MPFRATLGLVMLLALGACGGRVDPTATGTPSPASSPLASQDPPPPPPLTPHAGGFVCGPSICDKSMYCMELAPAAKDRSDESSSFECVFATAEDGSLTDGVVAKGCKPDDCACIDVHAGTLYCSGDAKHACTLKDGHAFVRCGPT